MEGKDRAEAGATDPLGEVTRGWRVDAYFEFSAASFSSLSSLKVRVQNDKMNIKLRKKPPRVQRRWGQCTVWGLQVTHLMMHSGIWMHSMGMSFSSSSKLPTYFNLLLNLALRKKAHIHAYVSAH